MGVGTLLNRITIKDDLISKKGRSQDTVDLENAIFFVIRKQSGELNPKLKHQEF